jgi:hypothetical protein
VDAPIVAQELRRRARALIGAFGATPGGVGVTDLRILVRPGGRRV